MSRLDGLTAIITGGASGFGLGIAQAYVGEGARVIIADIDEARAVEAADGLGQWAAAIACDVTSADDMNAVVERCLADFGRLDVFVNNAGYTHANKPCLEVSEEEFDRIYAVNVKALFHSVRAAVPVMRDAGGGLILTTASTAGVRPRPGLTWYNGSKGAAITLTKSLAAELAPWNIRVNAINPVIGETGLLEQFMGVPDTPENRARFIATIPMGRMSKPADIANAAVFFADPASSFITGVAMEVDGGRCV
jgi:3-oxoacyl-[acyl-carrier protein] reductase